MTRVQKAVFPGTMAGILFLLFFTHMLGGTRKSLSTEQVVVSAMQNMAPQPTATLDHTNTSISNNQGCAISPSFPPSIQQWCETISQYANQHGLDPDLVAAVMLQESGGNPQAYSKSGAVGLMQVMPKDGLAAKFQCINGPCFASRPSTEELYRPDFNIEYGTRLLSSLITHYGSVRDALKAYGPMDMGYRYADIVLAILEKNDQ